MDTEQVSPPFYGNFMTFYCRKMTRAEAEAAVAHTLAALLPLALPGGADAASAEAAVKALAVRALPSLPQAVGAKKA